MNYFDDLCVLGRSAKECNVAQRALLGSLRRLGFAVSLKKVDRDRLGEAGAAPPARQVCEITGPACRVSGETKSVQEGAGSAGRVAGALL